MLIASTDITVKDLTNMNLKAGINMKVKVSTNTYLKVCTNVNLTFSQEVNASKQFPNEKKFQYCGDLQKDKKSKK